MKPSKTQEQLLKELDEVHAENRILQQKIQEKNPVSVATSHDLTQQWMSTDQLHKLSMCVEQNPASVMITDFDGRIEYVNPKFESFTGYTSEEVIGEKPEILKSGVQTSEFYDDLWQHISSGKDWNGEFCNKKKSGELYWESATISPIVDNMGVITHFMALKEDITEHKQSLKSLLDSENKFRLLAEVTPSAIILVQGVQTVYANPYFSVLTGYGKDELLTMPFIELVHPDHQEMLFSISKDQYEGKEVPESFEHKLLTKQGEIKWVISAGVLTEHEGQPSILVTSFDITKRKTAEKELKSSLKREHFLADIFRKSPLAITLNFSDGTLDNCNSVYSELTGYSLKELRSFNGYQPLTPDKWMEFEAQQVSKLSPSNNCVRYEKEYICKDGKLIPIELLVTAQYDMDDCLINYIAFVSDITERKEAEAKVLKLNQELEQRVEQRTSELAASTERLSLATKVANLGVWEWDLKKDSIVWDDAMFGLYKMKADGFIGSYDMWLNLIHPDDKKRIERDIRLALAGERDLDSEFRAVLSNGTKLYLHVIAAVERDSVGEAIRMIGVNWDITEQKNAEHELRTSKLFLQSVLDTLSPQIVVFDTKEDIQLSNESWRKYWLDTALMKNGDEIGTNYFSLACNSEITEESTQIFRGIQDVINGKEDLFTHMFSHQRAGKVTYLSMNVHRVDIGKDTSIVLSTQDITELKAAEKSLIKAKDRAETAADIARLGHFEFDLNRREFTFNEQYFNLLDTSVDQEGGAVIPLNQYLQKFVFPVDRHILPKQIRSTLGKPDGYTGECEYRVLTRKQELRHMFVRYAIVKNESSFKVSGIHQDISERKEIEKALQSAMEFANEIVDSSPIPMAVSSIESGELIRVNQAMSELHQLTIEEMYAHRTAAMYCDVDIDRPQVLSKLKKDSKVDNFELKIKRVGTGEERWALISLHPIFYDGKQSVITSIIDITERKQALENITKLNSAVEQSSASVVITDLEGDIQHVNQAFIDITGYTFEEAIGQNPRVLKSGEHNEKFYRDMWQTISEGKVWEGEIVNKKKNGDLFWESASIAPVSNDAGELISYIAVKSDITEMKKAEKELIEAKELAEAATLAKSQFLANMSHEIRTPMNAIIGLSKLALKTELNSKQWDYLNKIDKSSQNLLRIINDILDFSKIEAGKLSIEKTNFNLEGVLQTVSSLTAHKAQEKGVEFIVKIDKDVPLYLMGDPLRISQLVTNYCSNAVKFTEKGEVILTASLIKRTRKYAKIKFSVSDTGIGLTDDQKKNIFQSFSQADQSTTRKYGGTGLGLSICKNLAELMGGEVDFESEYGRGSTFIFKAKFALQQNQHATQLLLPEDLLGLRVLVCDDNKAARMMLKERLETFSFKVDTVSNVKDVIKRIRNQGRSPYKLLVMDYEMPGIDGIAGYNMLMQDEHIQLPFTLMINVHLKDEAIKSVKNSGIENYLVKPVTCSPLFDSIIKAFGKTSLVAPLEPVTNDKMEAQLKKIQAARILLVEDIEVNQQIAKEFLEDAGFFVDLADNGQVAVEKVEASSKTKAYDLVLMDLQMPVMDGYDASIGIRKLKKTDELPIVAMTADAMLGVKEKCLAIGMQDMVSKPIDPELLFKALIKWIEPKKHKIKTSGNKQMKLALDLELPEIAGLNLESAMPRFNYKIKHFMNVLQSFYDNNQTVCAEMQEQFKDGEYKAAQRNAHSLKGVSASIGAESIHTIAVELEQGIIQKDAVLFKKHVSELEKALHRLFSEIAPKLEHTPMFRAPDYSLAMKLIPELREYIEAKKPDAKAMIAQLEDAGLCGLCFTKLKKALHAYDFKMAAIQLIELEKSINIK